jgi:signal peptidase
MRITARIARRTAGLLPGLAVLLVLAYVGLLVAGLRPVAVYSGSMVPQLPVGSIAIDRPVAASSVKVGDVVSFADPYVRGRLVTHRIIRIFRTDHGLAYRTKGDANPARDPWTISLPAQVGRVEASIPWAGYALVYARTREVRTALILVASLSILLAVLRRIWRRPEPTGVGIA